MLVAFDLDDPVAVVLLELGQLRGDLVIALAVDSDSLGMRAGLWLPQPSPYG